MVYLVLVKNYLFLLSANDRCVIQHDQAESRGLEFHRVMIFSGWKFCLLYTHAKIFNRGGKVSVNNCGRVYFKLRRRLQPSWYVMPERRRRQMCY